MAHFLLHIEGIPYLPCTKAFTINGGTAWEDYTALGCIDKVGESSYRIDPVTREIDVGDMVITCSDNDDTLTTLFGWRASAGRMFLDATIQQSTAMVGAGTITVDSLPAGITPLTVYIEGESFYCATQAGNNLTGVTREAWGSTAGYHQGYTGDDSYRPQVTTFPQFWSNRRCELWRIDNSDLDSSGNLNASGTRVWSGPLLQITADGLDGWKIKIGSVMRLLAQPVFNAPVLQSLAKLRSTDDDVNNKYWVHLAPRIEVVREGLTATALGTTTTTVCSSLGEPDDHWHSQYALHFLDSGLADYYASIESWDLGTTTFTHATMPIAVPNGTAFEIVRWNNFAPKDLPASWVPVAIGESVCEMRWTPPTSSPLQDVEGLTRYWQMRNRGNGFDDADIGDAPREVFTNVYREGDGVRGDPRTFIHPLVWMLRIMLSTGDGWNNATYDVLAQTHGAGIPAAWIDVDGIEDIIDECPVASTIRFAYIAPTPLKTIVEEMCALFGLYPALTSDGKLTLKRMEAPAYDEDPDVTLTEDHIEGTPRITQNHSGIVRAIKYKFNFLPYKDEFIASIVAGWKETQRLYPQSKIEEKSLHIWIGQGAVAEDVIDNLNDRVNEIAGSYLLPSAVRTLQRMGHPTHQVEVEVPLENIDGDVAEGLQPGNLVAVTHGQIPLPDGTRGCSLEMFEIRELIKDQMNNLAKVTLYWLPYLNRGARWAPSAEVTAWSSPNLTVDDTLFPAGTDAEDWFQDPDSGTKVDYIRIHYIGGVAGGRYGVTEELAVSSVSGNTIVINTVATPVTHAPVSGDVVTLADYDTSKTADPGTLIYAFLAKANDTNIIGDETVGTDDDEAYVYI